MSLKHVRRLIAEKLGRTPTAWISVNRGHITDSVKRSSSHCMIADAIKKAVPEASHVSVDLQTVRWTDQERGERYTYLTPRSGQTALIKFDQGAEDILPFKFKLYAGQTTRSARRQQRTKTQQKRDKSQKARLRKSASSGNQEVVGGRTPPGGALKRRTFGIRNLKY